SARTPTQPPTRRPPSRPPVRSQPTRGRSPRRTPKPNKLVRHVELVGQRCTEPDVDRLARVYSNCAVACVCLRTSASSIGEVGDTMKAIRYHRYGSPDVLDLQDIDMPEVGDDDVLVRVRAASVNPLDFHFMRGLPYLLRAQAGLSRPKGNGLGADMAGHVEAVGNNVTTFRAGGQVVGGRGRNARRGGTCAEYVSIRQDTAVLAKPANLTFEQAASVPVAAFTALQALRDKGRIQPGHKVLINGAAGGVGTFAVQIAKAFGAEV